MQSSLRPEPDLPSGRRGILRKVQLLLSGSHMVQSTPVQAQFVEFAQHRGVEARRQSVRRRTDETETTDAVPDARASAGEAPASLHGRRLLPPAVRGRSRLLRVRAGVARGPRVRVSRPREVPAGGVRSVRIPLRSGLVEVRRSVPEEAYSPAHRVRSADGAAHHPRAHFLRGEFMLLAVSLPWEQNALHW